MAGAGCLLLATALGARLADVRGDVAFDRLADRVVGLPSPVSGPVAAAMSGLADRRPAAMWFLVVAVTAVALHRRLLPGVAVLATGAVTQGMVLLGKRLVHRTLFSDGPSYPSGHMAGATALLVVAVLVVRHRGPWTAWVVGGLVSILPVMAALGAIWTQSHVWTDVIGGAMTGGGVALVLWSALVWREPDDRPALEDRDPSVLRPAAVGRPPWRPGG